MTFNERIVMLCKRNGISQSELERLLNIAKGSVTKWKTQEPKYSTMEKIAEYFCVSVNFLINGEEKKEREDMYYFDNETRDIAQEIFENPDMRGLFDIARNTPPERLKTYYDFIKQLHEQDKNN